MSLKFSDLLARALLEWPAEIELKSLRMYDYDASRYTVEGLAEISDEIEANHIGTVDEIIMRNLHYVIYGVIYAAAAYTTRIRVSELRPLEIQNGLERKMKRCMEDSRLGYTLKDIELAKRYFAENGRGGAS
jgi:hypothetical protein